MPLPLAGLLGQSVYSLLAWYADVNEAERLCHDPTFRLDGSEKFWDRGAAMASRLPAFETEMLGEEENLMDLTRLNRAVLDVDSIEIPVYGEPEQGA